MIFLYNLALFTILIPAIFALILLNRKRLRKESFRNWHERLGLWDFSRIERKNKPLLWFHCASLGEVRAVEPLIGKLGEFSILITVMTNSAHKYAEERELSRAVYFLPVDFSFILNNVMRKTSPDVLVLVETELWPGLVYSANKSGAKIISINGRLSVYSYPYYRLMRFLWGRVLSRINVVSVRTNEDADRFIGLGCPVEKIRVSGNIKYDAFFHMPEVSRASLGFSDSDLILVAGSTREGEEEILADLWLKLSRKYPKFKLVIAPRHITRASEISQLLEKAGIEHSMRSGDARKGVRCLILDTFGELRQYYSICDIAYVGGSMVNSGGQNPIEPAASGKPVVFGVYMQNFSEEAHILEYARGALKVKDSFELLGAVDVLAADRKFRLKTGENAKIAVENQKGAVDKTIELIKSCAVE
ncbi:MAG: glycosyltransferase N-terminal domain-containing protein [Elusimicrobiota bacterium]